jgi:hypothetical protein
MKVSVQVWGIQYSGSLPMIYKDEANPRFDNIFIPFEADGYEYYRSLRDPLLTRVTSYQVMFQATRDRPLLTSSPPGQIKTTTPKELEPLLAAHLEQAPDLSSIDQKQLETLFRVLVLVGEAVDEADCFPSLERREIATQVFKLSSSDLKERIAENVLDRNSAYVVTEGEAKRAFEAMQELVAGRINQIPHDLENAVVKVEAMLFLRSARLRRMEVNGDERLQAFNLYTQDTAKDAETYIKTPRVVISRVAGGELVGGHNLSGETTRIELDSSVLRGEARIVTRDNESVVLINPADLDHANAAAQAYAKRAVTGADRSTLQGKLKEALAETFAPRDMRSALVFDRPGDVNRGMAAMVPVVWTASGEE